MNRLKLWTLIVMLGATLSGCCGWGWYCGGGYHDHDRGGGGWDRGGDHDRGGGGDWGHDRGPEGH